MTKIVFYASQKSQKPKSHKKTQTPQALKSAKSQTVTSTPKSTNAHKIYKHLQARANHPKLPKTKKRPNKKPQKPIQTKTNPQKTNPPQTPKSQTPYPPSQIFANPLFVACQHLSHKIPCFLNHTPCQSSSLLVAYFGLPLCQRHT